MPSPLRRNALRLQPPARLGLGCLVLLAAGSACGHHPEIPAETPAFVHRWNEMMYTRFGITLPDGASAEVGFNSAFAAIAEVELTANEWKKGSPLAEVNRQAGGEPVVIPPSLMALLQRGVELGDLTHGAFDITWAALWGVWDFNANPPHIPEPGAIQQRLALINYQRLELDPGAGTAHLPTAGMAIGLGGIAKGWALDRAADTLHSAGMTDFLLQGGGQFLAAGAHGDRPWRVGIQDPRGSPDDIIATVELHDTSISTSGDYERYFEIDGVRYHHILDPHTGMPTRGLRSATVICKEATLADALSTALMVLGLTPALELAAQLPGVEVILVDDLGQLHASPGITPYLHIQEVSLQQQGLLPIHVQKESGPPGEVVTKPLPPGRQTAQATATR